MEIINKIKSLNLPEDQFCIIGSASLAIHGIRDYTDIDLLVTQSLYVL